MRTRTLRLIATVLAGSLAVVAPAIADKPDKKDRHEAKQDKKHENTHDKHEAKHEKRHDGKWVPADLSTDERGEWKNGRPPGWSQGAKRGWGGRDCPPGLAKKGQCAGDARGRLGQWGRDHRVSKPTLHAMLVGFEGAVRHGVPASVAERFVMVSAERGVSPQGIEAITRALAYGADRKAPLQALGTFAEDGVQRNVAADAIALGIYRLVADRR